MSIQENDLASDYTELVPSLPYDENTEPALFEKFEPGTRVLPAGFQTDPKFRPIPVDIVFEKDVAVPLRDGTVIYTDIFRPAGTDKVPVLVAWSPYGKSGGTHPKNWNLFNLLGVNQSGLSGLSKFEAPDPSYWVANGYAIANPDPRGIRHSEGDATIWTKQEGEDYYDLIEWLAAQEWSNEKVGLSGTSYLAISQWLAAAEQPPHLAAISPTEGMSDVYRDLIYRGGMPDFPFPAILAVNYVGANKRDDLVNDGQHNPLFTEVWKKRASELEKITVPAYVVASYTNSIHTPGTFRGWRTISSSDKWLRIHNTMEWPDFYNEANTRGLRRFFDHYLKGIDNGWQNTPRVRYSVLDLEGGDQVNVAATAFPPDDVEQVKYYLDPRSNALTTEAPTDRTATSYDAESPTDNATFSVTFDAETVIVGYPKAKLFVEADGSDDMDVFVLLQKLDAEGTVLEQFNVPNHGPAMEAITAHGASILKYKGSNGRLRASLRNLDETLSTVDVPVHTFDRVEKLELGEVVELEIDLFPVGLAFHPGETLRFTISGFNSLGGVMPNLDTVTPDNHGTHIIHTGGTRLSYLQLPVRRA
ncbi:CocE/NonD family hydrolase [Subtercola lobariae]|uniref:Hydrolase n=1 Tax=Subtercola lobariae TaxID=1588641 RepID=A0A917B8W1_9MICO|nr:CocE/NonD family hydrolase [Subtercola lobariae]GGF30701.1 hydrolase [Subtercola lobariae]